MLLDIMMPPRVGATVLMVEWTAMLSPSIAPVWLGGTALVSADCRMELMREREQTSGIWSSIKSVREFSRESR